MRMREIRIQCGGTQYTTIIIMCKQTARGKAMGVTKIRAAKTAASQTDGWTDKQGRYFYRGGGRALERGEDERAAGEHLGGDCWNRRPWSTDAAISNRAVVYDRVLLPCPLFALDALHLELIRRLASGNGWAVTVANGFLFRLPATAASGFAEYAGAFEGVCVELSVGALEVEWEGHVGSAEDTDASCGVAAGGGDAGVE